MDKIIRMKYDIPIHFYDDVVAFFDFGSEIKNPLRENVKVIYDGVEYALSILIITNTKNQLTCRISRFVDGIFQIAYRYILRDINELFYVRKIDFGKDDIPIYLSFELNLLKGKDYYLTKRNWIQHLSHINADYVVNLCRYNSFSNKKEKMELIYSLLVKKVLTNRYGNSIFKEYLMDKLEFLGYNYGYDKELELPNEISNSDEIFYYLMNCLVGNLYHFKKLPFMGQNVNKLHDLYNKYFEILYK